MHLNLFCPSCIPFLLSFFLFLEVFSLLLLCTGASNFCVLAVNNLLLGLLFPHFLATCSYASFSLFFSLLFPSSRSPSPPCTLICKAQPLDVGASCPPFLHTPVTPDPSSPGVSILAHLVSLVATISLTFDFFLSRIAFLFLFFSLLPGTTFLERRDAPGSLVLVLGSQCK